MGMWSTTGNTSRIIAKLEWKFGDVGMTALRRPANAIRRQRFDGTLQLHQIARMFRVWPGGPNASRRKHAKLWYGFLRWLHTQDNAANGGRTKVGDDIVDYMRDAITDPAGNCRAIKFIAIEDTDVRVGISGISAPLSGKPDAYILAILLQTQAHGGEQVDIVSVPNEDPPGEDIPDPDNDTSLAGARAARRLARGARKRVAKKKIAKKKVARKKVVKKVAKRKVARKKAAKK